MDLVGPGTRNIWMRRERIVSRRRIRASHAAAARTQGSAPRTHASDRRRRRPPPACRTRFPNKLRPSATATRAQSHPGGGGRRRPRKMVGRARRHQTSPPRTAGGPRKALTKTPIQARGDERDRPSASAPRPPTPPACAAGTRQHGQTDRVRGQDEHRRETSTPQHEMGSRPTPRWTVPVRAPLLRRLRFPATKLRRSSSRGRGRDTSRAPPRKTPTLVDAVRRDAEPVHQDPARSPARDRPRSRRWAASVRPPDAQQRLPACPRLTASPLRSRARATAMISSRLSADRRLRQAQQDAPSVAPRHDKPRPSPPRAARAVASAMRPESGPRRANAWISRPSVNSPHMAHRIAAPPAPA